MYRIGALFIIVLISLPVDAQREGTIDLLIEYTNRFGQADIEFPNPGDDDISELSTVISIYSVTPDVVRATISPVNIEYMRVFPFSYKIFDPPDSKAVVSALSVNEAMNWDRYPTYQQYDTIMHLFASNFPGICRVDTIGYSIEGKLVLALKISDNVNSDEDEPRVFYSSTIHGDELAGYVLMLRFIDHLLTNRSNGGIEQQLIDSLEIWINPLANPDGTYRLGDTISSPTRFNSNGVDLNRNYPDPTQSSSAIQQENADMISFMKERNFVLSANFHSGAEVLNFPWDRNYNDWDGKIHPDSSWFFTICKNYVDTVHLYSSPGYLDDVMSSGAYPGVTRGDAWYQAPGTRQDYVTYEIQGREVTIEIDYTKQTPASELPTIWNDNYRSLVRYLSNSLYGIHGKVIDNDTEAPVGAQIFLLGHDKDSSQVFSDSITGSFIRLLDKGLWDMAVSAEGYNTEYISNVSIEDFSRRNIVVRLQRDTSTIPQNSGDKLLIWPVPAINNLSIKLPGNFGNSIAVEIVNSVGAAVYRKDVIFVQDGLITIPVTSFGRGFYIVRVRELGTSHSITGRFIVR